MNRRFAERIANRDCRKYVQHRDAFVGSNLYSEHRIVGVYPHSDCRHYTVYSYGYHYPMFIHIPDVGWFENEDKSSRSTERQRSQAHPHTDTFKLSTEAMRYLDDKGYKRFVQQYILTGEMA
jgi:hypothetical protein